MNRPVTVRRGLLLGLVGVCAGLVLAFSLILRSSLTDERAGTLCSIFITQITESLDALGTPGSPGYAYYQAHPMERDSIVDRNLALLEELDAFPNCSVVQEATHNP